MFDKVLYSRSASTFDIAGIAKLAGILNFGLSMARLGLSINDESSKVTVLKHEKELIGFAISGDFVCGDFTLMNIAVSSEYRGNGFGKKILIEHLDFWKRKGALRCLLELRVSNKVARAFYTQAGFLCEGTREKYYRNGNSEEDAILMSLNL